ncbi:MAG TPA: tetratricopeptide repeat protein [Candidatus Eisenbacteria bacterium]|nr:tetratricopeptide repeat protein [Candidatus Eisenbacteria bacterium]
MTGLSRHKPGTILIVAGIVFAAGGCTGLLWSSEPARPSAPVTFNRDIAPIVYKYCAACHRPGEAGPFPLLTYQDVKKHAHQIVAVTQSRFMPPWLPAPEELKFADELRLSDDQLARIRAWVDQGMPEGKPSELPSKPKFVEGWQLGQPDLILKAEKPYMLQASGIDQYWNFILPVPIHETRWVRAVEIHPGDKRVVHHANILVDRYESARRMEREQGAGFGGMEIRIESEAFDPDSHFLFWKPGTVVRNEPDGMALRLDPGTDLVLNAHLQPSGKVELVQPSIGLYFTDKPATKHPMLLQLQNDAALDVPPGDSNFVVTDEFRLPIDVDLMGVYPHAHYLGKDLLATAVLPDGTTKTLIHIPHWDVNWQAVYRYAEPVFLPKGTMLKMHYVYDNSEDNTANPNHPPARVLGGNLSTDEMAHFWLQVLPLNDPSRPGDPRMVLQEAWARHEVEKSPGSFESRYNLGEMLQARGALDEAVEQFEAAVSIRPTDAVANNALGGALLARGDLAGAMKYFDVALTSQPDYFDAHYNLGNVFAAQGNFRGAAEQFGEAAKLNPRDANAQANLGTALAQLGRLGEARAHYEAALRIDPSNQLARDNLQQLERLTRESSH